MSTSFPPGGSTIIGVPGSVQFTARDPVPGGCRPTSCKASGVAYFEYSLDTAIPASGKLPGTGTRGTVPAPAAAPGHSVTATLTGLTISAWGPHSLYVEAVDHAGNRSTEVRYNFFVPDGWTNKLYFPVPGDVNHDGVPDLLAVTSSGGLNLYPGSTTSTALPAPIDATTPTGSPDGGADWNKYLITHRGSLIQGTVDDLYVQGGIALYIYENNPASPGSAPQYGSGSSLAVVSRPVCSATADNKNNCTGYDSTDWSKVSELLAIGSPFPGGTGADQVPAVLTVENGQLWFFQGSGPGILISPVLLGDDWAGTTLIAPGFIDGQLTLWARVNSTGKVYSFPVLIDANGLPTLNVAHPGQLVTPTQGTLLPGISLPATQYPAVASPGDAIGLPNLYAVDSSGNVWLYSGTLTGLGQTPTKIGTAPAGSIQELS
jgi:hypothetical protein